MTLIHANPGDVIDAWPLGSSLATTKTASPFKSEQVEVTRIVIPTGKEISEHEARGEMIVQCLEGRIAFTASGKTAELGAGQLIYLEAEEPHAVRCIEAASFLLTIVSNR